MIEIVINGKSRQVSQHTSLQELLRSLELKGDRVAVELNRKLVRREDWEQVLLCQNDRLEIVHFVGGG